MLRRGLLFGCAVAALAARPSLAAVDSPRPSRIAALAPSNADILFALGAASRVVAVSDFMGDAPEAAGKVRVGGFSPDLERLAALAPDLVVVSKDGTDRAAYEKLQKLGFHLLVTSGASLSGVFSDIRSVGAAIGETARAETLVKELQRRVDAAERQARARPGPRPSAVVVIWPDPPIVAGPKTFIGDLMTRAGLENPVPESAGEWPRVSFETLLLWNPSLLVRPRTKENDEAFRKTFSGDPRWGSIPAVAKGNVVTLPGDWIERPGPRLVDALERLASLPAPAP